MDPKMLHFKSIFLVFALVLGVKGQWRWEDKVAVVTGASSGIGAEIALILANKGVIVVGLARREEKIKELLTKTNGTIHAVTCDLHNEEDILKAFKWVEDALGGVDIMINNAGISIHSSLISGNTADWKKILDLNVLALSVCTREALKTMRTRGDSGHIININSIAGYTVPKFKNVYNGLYSASKFAVTALTEALAFELSEKKSNIKVTSLSPGLVATEFVLGLAGLGEKIKSGSMPYIDPTDIAEGVTYVLSTRPNVQIPELTIQPVGSSLCN